MQREQIRLDPFPWPMFEFMSPRETILAQGFGINFHVMYAEMEILKLVLSSGNGGQ